MITFNPSGFVQDPLTRLMYPFPELWTGGFIILTLLVALRLGLYAISAREDTGHYHFRIGSPLLYLLVWMFFGIVGLFIISLIHFGRLKKWSIFQLGDAIPRKFEDISTFIITVYFLLIFQLLPKSLYDSLQSLPSLFQFLDPLVWATGLLLLYIFINVRMGRSQSIKKDIGMTAIFFVGFLLFVGIEGLYIYLIAVSIRPFLTKGEGGKEWDGYYVRGDQELKRYSEKQKGSMNVIGNLMAHAVSGLASVTSDSISKLAKTIGEKIGVSEKKEEKQKENSGKEEKTQAKEEIKIDVEKEDNGKEKKKATASFLFLGVLIIFNDLILDFFFLPSGGLLSILADLILVGVMIYILGSKSKLNWFLTIIVGFLEIFGYGGYPLFFIYLLVASMIPFIHLVTPENRKVALISSVILILVVFGGANYGFGETISQVRSNTQQFRPDFSLITNIPQSISERFQNTKKQLKLATLPYYATQVENDENSKDIGLTLKINPSGSQQFYEGVPGRVSATLKGKLTKDLMKECFTNSTLSKCQVSTYCSLDGQGPADTGKTNAFSFTEIGNQKTIICDFTPLSSTKLKLGAEFEFNTKARVPFYAMKQEDYNSYSGIDSLSDRQIIEKFGYKIPVSKRTPGPVELKIGVDNTIVRIPETDSDASLPTNFGFTIFSNDGKITEISDVVIFVPQGFELDKSSCNYPFSFERDVEAEIEGEKVYRLVSVISGYEISDFLTVNCLLYPDSFSESFSAGIPLSGEKWLVVEVNTKNVIERSTSLSVRPRSQSKDFESIPTLDVCPKDVNICGDYPSGQWCSNDPCLLNCVRFVGLFGSYSSCGQCPSDLECGDYGNENYCSLDSCKMGCSWVDEACVGFGVEKNLGWPLKKTKEVLGCDENDKNRLILSDFEKELRAPASGDILTGSETGLTIDHGDGYKTTFFQLDSVRRAKGNVRKNEVIGFASKDTMFEITKSGKTINLFDFYEKKKIKIKSRDPSCMVKEEVDEAIKVET